MSDTAQERARRLKLIEHLDMADMVEEIELAEAAAQAPLLERIESLKVWIRAAMVNDYSLCAPPEMVDLINQCDGCQAGIPVNDDGYHRMGKFRAYPDYMACQKGKYDRG